MSNLELVAQAMAGVFPAGEVEMDDAAVRRMIEAVRPFAAPDFTALMSGRDTVDREFDGVAGLRDGWEDWLDTFPSVRFELESAEEIGDNVLMLARQVGTTRHGAEVEQASAAVWKFRDGRLARLEFHLDRSRAIESARVPA